VKAIALIVTLALGILVAPRASHAQPPTHVHRIGYLSPGFAPAPLSPVEALRQGLRDLGWVEGENLTIAYRAAEGEVERLPVLAAELVQLPVEVIVAGGSAAIHAAQHATRTIPIVMATANEPVGEGFVVSVARPGGNITGLSNLAAELPGKRLEILKETVPQSTRIAVLANPANASHASDFHHVTEAARALGLSLHLVEVRRAEELESAFAAMTHAGADALIVLSDPALMAPLQGRVVDLAAERRLPAIYDWKFYVESGGLMSYGPSFQDIYRRTATYVDKLLKGATPADLPVEQAIKFELGLNLKTAKALGITIPASLLLLADGVIQ
jgi:putative tryptophan/tyrosine transport system substrate-binding protein